ncbi:hypothetical protein Rhal01_02063 [Rubritalea halochordaticola]|uniref:Uncharacterized protein n=1 Tax=Rubritalea halochordaticola TaxID=714537 RepID=A0ABP9UZS9_9BACT
METPYATPNSSPDAGVILEADQLLLDKAASGLSLINLAILVNICSVVLMYAVSPLLGLLALVGLAMALVGIIRVGVGTKAGTLMTVFYVLLMFVPYLNILILLAVNSRASNHLKKHGYKVGLVGAKKPS